MLGLKDLAAIAAKHTTALEAVVRPFDIAGQVSFPSARPAVMGVINLSADSWYRESVCTSIESAVERGSELRAQGADIIDIGAESTLSQAQRVGAAEQRQRLLPVIGQLASQGIIVSAETYDAEVAKACLRSAEVDAKVDEWGVMCPAELPLQVARNLFIRMYPRMVEILQLLGSSSLMALPSEADLNGPLATEIERYLDTDTATAKERVRIFRLAWDTCCSAFGSRQVLYERFFQADSLRNAVLLYNMCDREPMTEWVREFLEQE